MHKVEEKCTLDIDWKTGRKENTRKIKIDGLTANIAMGLREIR
jgi:hypothetical protein